MGVPDNTLSHLTTAAKALSNAFRCAWNDGDRAAAGRISNVHAQVAREIEAAIEPGVAPAAHLYVIGGEA